MLGNCDKIITPLSSTTNQWPQNQIILDDQKSSMASSSTAANINKAAALMAAEKTNPNPNPNPNQQQQQEHPHNLHPLKCPRCDSSNTKFCYYNNYSLSQPRHFCKACKRYWTRGGTLRNVPVGGGCRKNKRHKRHSSDSNSLSSNSNSLSSNSNTQQIDLPPPSSHNPPLFYGNPLELNFPFSSFRVSSDDSALDQISALGLGFSSDSGLQNNGYKNGFKPIQDASSSPFSAAALPHNNNNNNNSIFFGSSSSFSTASTMASLLASTQKFGAPGLMPNFEDPRMPGTGKQQVKAEGENNNSSSRQLAAAWNPNPNPNQSPNLNPIDQMNSSDPSSLVWNTSSIGGWFDPSSMGSSVPSLI